MSERRVPLSDLAYGPEEEAAVLRVLRSRWLSMGPEVQAFETEFAAMIGIKHAFAVANGTAAIHLAFLALELGEGDEIVQPAVNFVASANLTIAIRAVPVFADIVSLDEPTIDPAELERLITPRTRAVVVMHYGGYLSRMAEIVEICRTHHLALIEDACHAVGSRYVDASERPPDGEMAGRLGDVACFSFFSNKNMAVGEGGMVVTDRDDLAQSIRALRSHGMTSLSWDRHRGHASSYDVVANGFNYRLDELHAALGRSQLEKLPGLNQRRRELVACYRSDLEDLHGWVIPFSDYEGETSCHLMVAVAPDPEMREVVVRRLNESGIQTSLHYPCIADFQAFQHVGVQGLERSRSYVARTITLPLHPGLDEGTVHEITSLIRDCVG